MEAPTTVAIVGQVLTAAILLIRHFAARRSPSCDYRHNQLRLRMDRQDVRIDELEAAQLRTAENVQHLHREVAILKRLKESA
jgi:hypothetical protein